MRRRLSALALAGASVTALSACDLAFASTTFEDGATLQGKITSVELDIGSGRVNLNGGSSKASLRRSVKYRGDRPEGVTYRIENGVLKLRGCGSRCSVRYTVDLPAGLPVSGKTSSGSIHLSRVGAVNVSTDSGSIHLHEVAGPIKARTDNGEIEGRGLRGAGTDVKTDNGDVSLTPAKAQNIRAETDNGEIKVTVPAGRYRVTSHVGNGDRTIDVPNDASAPYLLDLRTDNGDITAKPAA
ncbi:DUF4097 domain-containing protein [Actinomadura madurae]|uniref:Putative adhesin n=1 Tax=Actinomadura madurae TaxID=1993 RepID=A0A1I5VII0_9ACTN|nr:DUF4097 family beta strand repeat-containing protein [Actinomadura madurae]SFQ07221.1 Putative adhesin [Actinomadura madurae]